MAFDDISSLSVEEFDALSKDDVKALLFQGRVTVEQTVERVTSDTGDIKKLVQIWRDMLSGAFLGDIEVNWTYYHSGMVDEIVSETTDAAGNVVASMTVKHYEDGQQPEIITSSGAKVNA